MLERREWVRANCDHLRTALMLEPRGHADMYGALLTEPERPDSDAGVLFMHNEGYSTMCGHGVIAVVTMAIERGLIVPRGGRRDRARCAGRTDSRARRRFAARQTGRASSASASSTCRRSSCTRRCPFASAAARSASTWRSAARSTRSSMRKSAGLPVAAEHLADLRRAGMAIKHAVEAAVHGRASRASPGSTASTAPSSPGRRRPTRRTCAT